MKNKNKIKPSLNNTENMQTIKTSKNNFEDKRDIIVFESFKGYSININGFNNYYANQKSSINTVEQFISRLKDIETHNNSLIIKHSHQIENPNEVDIINRVLKDGYNFSAGKIKSFENTYYVIPFGNGQRIICSKVDNIIELLFIDSNHMVYKDSCRFLKVKECFDYPSCLGKINFSKDYNEYGQTELLKMIVDDYELGNCTDPDEIIENIKYILQCENEEVDSKETTLV